MNKQNKPIDDLEAGWMQDIEAGRVQSDKVAKQRLAGKMMVDQSLKKSHPLSLRIPDADLEAIQLKAAKVGENRLPLGQPCDKQDDHRGKNRFCDQDQFSPLNLPM